MVMRNVIEELPQPPALPGDLAADGKLCAGLLVPDGVGVRNFVLGPFLNLLRRAGPVHVFHAIDPLDFAQVANCEGDGVSWHFLPDFVDTPTSYLLRQSLSAAHLYAVDTSAMREARSRPPRGSLKIRAATHLARCCGRICATRRGMRWLDRLHTACVGRSEQVARYRRLFETLRPAVLFCSHQRPPRVIPPILAARQLGIPTATFIFSWDNLSSKGRVAAPFDHYLLWSELMRTELLRYYPDVDRERTHVVGTPQFDPYGMADLLWSREEFCRRLGADPRRPLICYSGGDTTNSRADQDHLRMLLELVHSGRIRGNPQVVLRPAPVDDGRRYQPVLRDFPTLIYAQPAWKAARTPQAETTPLPEDVPFLANLTHHSDLNVNFASTMTLDFAIHDRPVVNVAIETAQPPVYGISMLDFIRQFDHYRPVMELGAARVALTIDQLAAHVNAYLDDPSLDRPGRQRFVELEVGVPIGRSSQRIVETLRKIAAHGAPSKAPQGE